MPCCIRPLCLFCVLFTLMPDGMTACQAAPALPPAPSLFARDNLVAWCIVPFDGKKRGPEARAAMLERLGIQQLAYDYRAEHIATFDAELDALARHGIRLTAWWFPPTLNDEARGILGVLKRHGVKTQLWVTGGGAPAASEVLQQQRVEAEAQRIRPIAEAAAAMGCQVGLYNHGGWFGEPENQIAIIEKLKLANVGIVYNLHHGHQHLKRFAQLLRQMKPYLLALNLNGMDSAPDPGEKKILPLGAGRYDLQLLRTIRASGWRGPIGILNHTDQDAEARLRDNLDGLAWLVARLDGNDAGPPPKYRSFKDQSPLKNMALPASTVSSVDSANPLAQPSPAAAPMPAPGPHLMPTDDQLRTVLIDQSEREVFLAVKADSEGRLFVGGSEGLFVYEPKKEPRRESVKETENGPETGPKHQPQTSVPYQPRRELFRFPADSIILGIEIRGNDLYVLTSSALYLIPEGRVRRAGLRPRRLLWGVPHNLHNSFHCLAWGPEGDLYLDHGDPILGDGDTHRGCWTLYPRPAGTRLPYTGSGAVLRIRPDGSQVHVVAGGLRGPVGLAFDPQWNLFTNDNDHESQADRYAPIRLLHVAAEINFGWPGGWLPSLSPDRSDLVETMTTALGRGVPCALAYYDQPYLAVAVRNKLLQCRWARATVTANAIQPRGASFSARESVLLSGRDHARPTGIGVGRGGRLFVTSLYLTGNVTSPHCPSDLVMITRADDGPSHPFESYDLTGRSADRLYQDLKSPSWQRRQWAHQELLRRGAPVLREANRRLAETSADSPAYPHLIWLAGASKSATALETLVSLAEQRAGVVRRQALRALAEFLPVEGQKKLRERLAKICAEGLTTAGTEVDPAFTLLALQEYFRAAGPLPLAKIACLAGGKDTYLRQTAARLLARRATIRQLRQLLDSPQPADRLAGVLAAGMRLTEAPADELPPANIPLRLAKEGDFFKRTYHFADPPHMVELTSNGPVGSYTLAQRWKIGPHTDQQGQLFRLLVVALEDPSAAARLSAAHSLSLLGDPALGPRIEQVRQQVILAGFSPTWHPVEQGWLLGPLDTQAAANSPPPPGPGMIDLAAVYPTSGGPQSWRQTEATADGFTILASKAGSYQAIYFQLQSLARQAALLTIRAPARYQLFHNGRPVTRLVGTTNASAGSPSVDASANASAMGGWLLDLQPGSNDLALRVPASRQAASLQLGYRAASGVLAALPEKVGTALLAARLQEATSSTGQTVAAEFLKLDWRQEAERGNPEQGRRLFGSLGCAKCHAIVAGQSGGGAPSLLGAAKRFTVAHLVESILLPSKQIAGPFRSTVLVTANGKTLSGLVVAETDQTLELLLPDTTHRQLPRDAIEQRELSDLSPMPAGLVKTTAELRNLLAYLKSDRPAPP